MQRKSASRMDGVAQAKTQRLQREAAVRGASGLLHMGRPSDHVGEQSETKLDRWIVFGLREG